MSADCYMVDDDADGGGGDDSVAVSSGDVLDLNAFVLLDDVMMTDTEIIDDHLLI